MGFKEILAQLDNQLLWPVSNSSFCLISSQSIMFLKIILEFCQNYLGPRQNYLEISLNRLTKISIAYV